LVLNIHTDAPTKRPAIVAYFAQALGGALFGVALGGAAGLIGARLFAGTSEGWGDLIAAIVGAIIGYTLGVSLGVYVIGNQLGGRGGYWRALLGWVIGSALVLLAAEPLHLNQNTAVLQTYLIALPPIGATLGFNLSRKARR
jgi:integral membrane sensor domain MASE1